MLWAIDDDRTQTGCWCSTTRTSSAGADRRGGAAPTSRPGGIHGELTHEWNHGLGEIVTALLDAGMELTLLEEHQSVPWTAIPGQMRTSAAARCS